MKKDAVEKLVKIQELLHKKEEIEKELESLLTPEPKSPLPIDFSINEEIIKLLNSHPDGLSNKTILKTLKSSFPFLDRKQINGALVYLSLKKKTVERIGRGMYRMKRPSGS